ncbi:tyrosine kinase [Echinococcus multilocularis]|uniref:Tyrosine-protein kinase n=1 Tax=Echinococcus multilocularis TaxID=6211 RepID=A0A087W099_ECHMU|nr:tyrosine kinase [Echinococcus multilocularis]
MARPGVGGVRSRRQSGESASISPHSVSYFHGKITRDQAEAALFAHKALEGLFLLRESVHQNYAISICHGGRVHHYNIEKQPDGSYQIRTGRKFPGPVELVKHHAVQLDGFLTLARFPLDRPTGESPIVLQGVRSDELEEKLRLKAMEMGLKGPSVTEALAGPMRDHLRYLVLRDLHFLQPWYHDCIRRRESERRLEENGGGNGSFLVRYRKEDGAYVLSLMYEKEPRHYKIEQHLNRLSIEGGQYFETLIEMIDHYHFRQDGLLCKLRKVVAAPDFIRTKQDSASISSESLEGSPNSLKNTGSSINNSKGASHSLPSLASCPFNSATSDNLGGGSPVLRKVCDDVMHASNDLISFNDWPNVTSLLTNQNVNSNATANNNNNIGGGKLPQNNITVKRISAVPVAKFLRPNLPSLQSVNLGYGDGIVHTPFTPVSTEATPTPRPGTVTSSPTSPFSRVRLKPTFTSTSGGTTVTTATTASNTIANEVSQPRPLQALVTCPLIPEVLRATNNSNTGALQRSPTTVRFAQAQLPCKFAPNNSLPPESLNFPPIIDALWEEPDGSEDRSQPSSSLVSINVEALPPPPPHILNPFIQRTSSQTSVNLQPCHHAPGVSTFCNSACCQPKHQLQQKQQQQKADEIVVEKIEKEEVSPTKPPSSVLPAIEEAQKIYDSLPDNTLFLQPDSIRLMDRLGGGNFGQVVKAIYKTPQGQEVEVAVKTLRESQIASTGEQTILSEAETMTHLKHRHIVRLIGVCKAQHFMLVLELAPLGPINKYLKKHPDTPVWVLSELMHQVAQGMAYLEACKLVHRDLAARNVLLVTQRFAKVSDFGMSKALNFGNDYYRAASAGKWPLKWYAPECIYYFRFDSKSDVWSYGITLWEVFSYGERPYKDMKGAQILAMLDQGLRLSRPVRCPEAIYAVMQQCWNAEGVRRPTFAELVLTMSRLAKGPLYPNNFSGCHENERGAGVSGESVGAFAFF